MYIGRTTYIDFDDTADEDSGLLPGIGESEEFNTSNQSSFDMNSNVVESIKPKVDYSMSSLNSLITKDKKIVTREDRQLWPI